MVTILGRLTWYYWSAAASARRCRARHDDVLAVIARPGPATDIRIIDSGHPAVYCLPGRRRIVLTTGALSSLDRSQLDAVLAHERAHLSGRHHLVLRLAAALERIFPRVRFFAVAAEQVAYLVEVAADDAAAPDPPAHRGHGAAGRGGRWRPGRCPRRGWQRCGPAHRAPHRPSVAQQRRAASRYLRRAGHGDRPGRHRVRAGTLGDHPLPPGGRFSW